MKQIAIIIIQIFFFSVASASQETTNSLNFNNDLKQEKPDKKSEVEKKFKRMEQILGNREFVLEADYLSNQYGSRIPVTSTLNFIKVDSTDGVIQIGSNSGMGYNGVGGVTADGNITKYNLDINEKRKTFFIQMTIMTSIGTYDVSMSVSPDGYANATLSGMRRGRLNYSGNVVPLQATRTFEGTTSY
jgi:hypothetical protein